MEVSGRWLRHAGPTSAVVRVFQVVPSWGKAFLSESQETFRVIPAMPNGPKARDCVGFDRLNEDAE
jgi:hypothetical protein